MRAPTAPLPNNLVRVPVVRQRTGFSCGGASALALLRYWRWETYAAVDETTLHAPLGTTHAKGTDPEPIAAFLRSLGLDAQYRHGDPTIADLEHAIDAGEPPIVDLQAWSDHEGSLREVWDAGHYVVMVGHDEDRLFFMDPSTLVPDGYAFLPRAELGERWHDVAGEADTRFERMVIFVRGSPPRHTTPPSSLAAATRLG